jgi:predicted DNA-binding transcriptional regulator YafY
MTKKKTPTRRGNRKPTLAGLQQALQLWLQLPCGQGSNGLSAQEIIESNRFDITVQRGQLLRRLNAMKASGYVESLTGDDGELRWRALTADDAAPRSLKQRQVAVSLLDQLAGFGTAGLYKVLAREVALAGRPELVLAPDWADKYAVVQSGFSLQPPDIRPGIVETVREALACDAGLRGVYVNGAGERSETLIPPPLGLLAKGNLSYLFSVSDSGEPRWRRLDRFLSLEIDDSLEPQKPRQDFRQLIASGGDQFPWEQGPAQHCFVAWAAEDMARILRERPLYAGLDLKEVTDGRPADGCRVLVEHMPIGAHFEGFLLAASADLVCLKPKDVREKTWVRLQAAVAAYAEPEPNTGSGSKVLDMPAALDFDRGEGATVTLRARLSRRLAESYTETPFCEQSSVSVNPQSGGTASELVATLPLTMDVLNYIVSRAEEFVVLEPANLRQRILDRHQRGLEAYASHC